MSYFKDALGDFVHDVASGGQIRHLIDQGKNIDQIVEMLDYHTSRDRVEKTAYKYLKEQGRRLLKSEFMFQEYEIATIASESRGQLHEKLRVLMLDKKVYLLFDFQKYINMKMLAEDFPGFTKGEIKFIYDFLVAEEAVLWKITEQTIELCIEIIIQGMEDLYAHREK